MAKLKYSEKLKTFEEKTLCRNMMRNSHGKSSEGKTDNDDRRINYPSSMNTMSQEKFVEDSRTDRTSTNVNNTVFSKRSILQLHAL